MDPLLKKQLSQTLTDVNIDDMGDFMMLYDEKSLTKEAIKQEIIGIGSNFSVLFDIDKFLGDTRKSFKGRDDDDIFKNMLNQIHLDYHRMHVHFHGQRCDDVEEFIDLIMKMQFKKHYICENMFNLIIMLVTQSPFCYLFKTIVDLYNDFVKDNYVCQDSDYPYINVTINKNTIEFTFRKSFRLLNIKTNTTYKRFHTVLIFNVNFIDTYAKRDRVGMVYWITEKMKH